MIKHPVYYTNIPPCKYIFWISGVGGVDSGDSGAGLTYRFDNSYYLTGIVSSKERKNNKTGAVFTDIRYHMDWIFEIYNYFKSNSFNIKQFICSHYGSWSLTYRNLCSSKYHLYVDI